MYLAMMELMCRTLIVFISLNSVCGSSSKDTYKETNKKSNLASREPDSPLISNNDNSQSNLNRQKRWYDFYGFAPPVFDLPDNRIENPLSQIHRRLQDIANVGRQPPIPPPLQAFPIPLIPHIIYIDSYKCRCDGDKPKKPKTDDDESVPKVPNRTPDVESNGVNRTDDADEDVGRPISFDPIRPNRTLDRPPLPVDHGTIQAGGMIEQPPSNPPPLLPEQTPQIPLEFYSPTACDGAVLSCCHQREVTYECFVSQGCADLSSVVNPCDSNVILSAINKFQMFYAQRNGIN